MRRILRKLGEDIRDARRRRRLPMAVVAGERGSYPELVAVLTRSRTTHDRVRMDCDEVANCDLIALWEEFDLPGRDAHQQRASAGGRFTQRVIAIPSRVIIGLPGGNTGPLMVNA